MSEIEAAIATPRNMNKRGTMHITTVYMYVYKLITECIECYSLSESNHRYINVIFI